MTKDKYISIDTETGMPAAEEISMDRVHDIFASIATKYERFNKLSSFGTYKIWVKKLVELTPVKPNSIVLDLAAGTGEISFAIANTYHPKMIICSDLVPEMLDVAKSLQDKKCKNISSTEIEYKVIDAQSIPFEDNSFDYITMAYGLRNIPNREKSLNEIFRVLKPGGQFSCLDFSTPTNPIWNAMYQVYLKHMIPFWGKTITGDSSGFIYLAKSIKAFPNQDGVANLMKQAGFKDIKWHNCTGGIACIHTATK